MSTNVLASMSVVLGANIKGFERSMAIARKDLQGFVKAGEKLKDIGSQMSMYLTAPLTLLGGVALKTAGDMQALEKGFAATYKGAGDLNEELKLTREVAKLPGLGLKEALQGVTNLQAVGFAAEQSRDILKGFGNALATVGKGKAELDGVVTALSQMAAKGKISAEEINQIAERVPQIRAVMKSAFGTADTEELQKMGISVDTFVAKVTGELNKLPKVTGGINNAFENMSDVGTQALTALGTAINNNFNIEGLMNRIGDAMSGVISAFENLSPVAQKAILLVGGLAAVAGPLVFAIGAISAALPALTVGLAAVTGPIGLTVAAIAGAAALIIANWDIIAAYFTSGGGSEIFEKVRIAATKAFNAISAVIRAFVGAAQALWKTFGGAIMAVATFLWDNLQAGFGRAFEGIGGVFDVFRATFEGDWGKLWQSLKYLAALALNSVLDLVGNITLAIPKLLSSALKGLKIDNAFTQGLDAGINNTRKLLNFLKVEAKAAYGEVTTIPTPKTTTPEGTTTPTVPGASGVSEAAKAQIGILAALKKEFNDATKLSQVFGLSQDTVTAKTGALTKAITQLIEGGLSPQSATIQRLKGELNGLNTLDLSPLQNTFEMFLGSTSVALDSFSEKIKTLPVTVTAVIDQMSAKMISFVESATPVVQQGFVDMFAGVGEIIGQSAATASLSVGQLAGVILSPLADMAIQVGKIAIGIGIGIEGIRSALASMNPAAALAAGVALVALGSFAKSALSKVSSGGGGGGASAPRISTGIGGGFNQPRTTNPTYDGPKEIILRAQGPDLIATMDRQLYKTGRFRG